MTATRDVTVWCDGKTAAGHQCPSYDQGETAAEVRQGLGRPGPGRWLVGLPGGRDLCPEHVDQRHDETRFGDGR